MHWYLTLFFINFEIDDLEYPNSLMQHKLIAPLLAGGTHFDSSPKFESLKYRMKLVLYLSL